MGWTVDWQRHYAYLTQLLAQGARPTAVVPGVTRHGEDIGRWLATQRRDWDRLNEEQQHRLAELGVKPARVVRARTAAATTDTASTSGLGTEAFQKGVQALTQYLEREGGGFPGRAHIEQLPEEPSTAPGYGSSTRSSAATDRSRPRAVSRSSRRCTICSARTSRSSTGRRRRGPVGVRPTPGLRPPTATGARCRSRSGGRSRPPRVAALALGRRVPGAYLPLSRCQ
ncbi:helicase associated domain-containing protein [Streptomyces virginiae]|uniref:helicase associated domain-containing protein n=1 Tax=Streptomyces virginiae TaxID=1961 RepID=UPI0034211879